MKLKLRLLISSLLVLAVAVGLIGLKKQKRAPGLAEVNVIDNFDSELFLDGSLRSSSELTEVQGKIVGGVVPHHLVAGSMLSDFFRRFAIDPPHSVILVGPNHSNKGNSKAILSQRAWKTPFGVVNPDTDIYTSLASHSLFQVDEKVIAQEHSVTNLIPYIKYYLPGVKVTPVIVNAFASLDDAEDIAGEIAPLLGDDVMLIASVDFSHYLEQAQALENDSYTLDLIKSENYEVLMSLDSDYLDSPTSIVSLLMAMNELGAYRLNVLGHSDSGEVLDQLTPETTTYFSLAFTIDELVDSSN